MIFYETTRKKTKENFILIINIEQINKIIIK